MGNRGATRKRDLRLHPRCFSGSWLELRPQFPSQHNGNSGLPPSQMVVKANCSEISLSWVTSLLKLSILERLNCASQEEVWEGLELKGLCLGNLLQGKMLSQLKCVGLPSCPDWSDKCNCFVLRTISVISVIAAAVVRLGFCARLLLAPEAISRAAQRPPLSEVPLGTAVRRDWHCAWQKFGCFWSSVSLCVR